MAQTRFLLLSGPQAPELSLGIESIPDPEDAPAEEKYQHRLRQARPLADVLQVQLGQSVEVHCRSELPNNHHY